MDQSRTTQLLGEAVVRRLGQVRVLLVGVGGVGGWCAEALIRSGIQHLTIVDFDTVSTSNINRQIVATEANVGRSKVEEMRQRLLDIHPQADIVAIDERVVPGEAWRERIGNYDYIIDAIDDVDAKAWLMYEGSLTQATVFSSMGAGRKLDTEQIQIAEFWKVHGCPLARALRNRMKKEHRIPAKKIRCVYSPEISAEAGTIAPIVGVFGMKLANLLIQNEVARMSE